MIEKKEGYDFYFTHNPSMVQNLIRILEDGYIRPGNELPESYHVLGGIAQLSEIYGNILFDNLQKKQAYWGIEIILNPKIVEEYDFGYRFGWQGDELLVKSRKNNKNFWRQMRLINNLLKTAKLDYISNLGEKEHIKLHNIHEIVFFKKIPVREYVSAIRCDLLLQEDINKIKKIIDKKKYNISLIKRICSHELTTAERKKCLRVLKLEEII